MSLVCGNTSPAGAALIGRVTDLLLFLCWQPCMTVLLGAFVDCWIKPDKNMSIIFGQRERTVEGLSWNCGLRSYLVTCREIFRCICNISNHTFYNYVILKVNVLMKNAKQKVLLNTWFNCKAVQKQWLEILTNLMTVTTLFKRCTRAFVWHFTATILLATSSVVSLKCCSCFVELSINTMNALNIRQLALRICAG